VWVNCNILKVVSPYWKLVATLEVEGALLRTGVSQILSENVTE